MNPKILSDLAIWRIWCAIESDPEEQRRPAPFVAIHCVRTWLGNPRTPIPALENLSLELWGKGQDELAVFIEELASARRERN